MKPIDTIYKGYKFRSRLEARWAVFLDGCEFEFTFEEQGFELPSGWYLPDFYLPRFRLFLEVKAKDLFPEGWNMPEHALPDSSWPEEVRKAAELGYAKDGSIVVFGDPVDFLEGNAFWFAADIQRVTFFQIVHHSLHAALAARQARFEHGENPL